MPELPDVETAEMVTCSVIVSEVVDASGERWITTGTDGDPSPWYVLGMLQYAIEMWRRDIAAEPDDED